MNYLSESERRPRVPCGCRADMEQFTAGRHVVTIAANVQASPQDSSLRSKLLRNLRLRIIVLSRRDSRLFRLFMRCPSIF